MDIEPIWDQTKDALADAYQDVVGFAVGAVEALVVALAAVFVARYLRRRVARALGRSRLDPNVAALAANAVTIGTYVVAVTVALALLGASWTALVAVLGASTVAISLALQDVLRSLVAGVYLLLERPFAIGDRIRVGDVEGRVEGIDIRTTALRTDDDERVLVPNATVFAGIVTNRSAAELRRTTVTAKGVTVPPGELVAAVTQALAGVAELGDRPPTLEIVAAGEDGLEVALNLAHPPEADVLPAVVTRLRERFPEASVVVGRA